MPIAPGNVKFTYAQLMGIWEQAGGSSTQAALAAAISMAESGGNSTAYHIDTNGSIDRGLWQINSSHGNASSFDVMTNARAAVSLSCNGKCTNSCSPRGYTGWGNWTTYCSGAFRQFYASGTVADNHVPINATNAAANQPAIETNAVLTGGTCWAPWNLLSCGLGAIGRAAGGAASSAASGVAQAVLGAIIKYVIDPLIEIVAGVIGMLGGGILMIVGLYQIVKSTEAYESIQAQKQKAQGAALVGIGAVTGQPEIIAAGAASAPKGLAAGGRQRVTTMRGQETEARQGRLIGQRKTGQLAVAEERTRREQVRQEALNFRARLAAEREGR